MGFTEPTPIQAEVIPLMLSGEDVLAQAPTGTGKTCAFGIPVINAVDVNNSLVQSLVLCPTRELAMQIERELKKIASHTQVRILALFGGQNIERQMAGLRRKPHVVVGTPGRVIDHIRRKTLKLHGVNTLVLDEADEMLDMGFRGDIDQIEQKLPPKRQTALLSATMAKEILEISRSYQIDPVSVKTTVGEFEVPEIGQYYVKLSEDKKYEALKRILRERDYKFVLVFCNTKARVEALYEKLDSDGYLCAGLHGDLKQRFRDKIMKAYRAKQLNVLVATDVAARGIDVDGVEAIFNYDVPLDEEFYVHRIGRTARANKTGEAISFVTKRDIYRLNIYEKLTKTPIEEMVLDGLSLGFTSKEKNQELFRVFLNLGSKDKIGEAELKRFVGSNSKIGIDEVKNVRICDLYSFFEVKPEFMQDALSLNGRKYLGRFIAVEAAGKEKQTDKNIKQSYGKQKNAAKKGGNKKHDGKKKPISDKNQSYNKSEKSVKNNDFDFGKRDLTGSTKTKNTSGKNKNAAKNSKNADYVDSGKKRNSGNNSNGSGKNTRGAKNANGGKNANNANLGGKAKFGKNVSGGKNSKGKSNAKNKKHDVNSHIEKPKKRYYFDEGY